MITPFLLALHDWKNLSPAERETALSDVRTLAATFGEASTRGPGRRPRALNIIASLVHFLTPPPTANSPEICGQQGGVISPELGHVRGCCGYERGHFGPHSWEIAE